MPLIGWIIVHRFAQNLRNRWLVVALGLMSRFLKDADVSPQQPAAAAPGGTVAAADLNDPELLSAITAAVHSFRAKREEPSSKNTK